MEQVASKHALASWIVERSSAKDYRSSAQGRLELRRPLIRGIHAIVWCMTALVWGVLGAFFALLFGFLARDASLALSFVAGSLVVGALMTLAVFYRGGLLRGRRVSVDGRTIQIHEGNRVERVDVGEVERVSAEYPGDGAVWRVRIELASGAQITLCDCLDEREATALSELVDEQLGRRRA